MLNASTSVSSFDSLPPFEDWLIVSGKRGSRTTLDTNDVIAQLKKISTGKNKSALTLKILLGKSVMTHLGIEAGKDSAILLQHPDDLHFFMLIKSNSGYKVAANGGNKNVGNIALRFQHPTLKMINSTKIQYSLHPNKTITFRLNNTLK